MVLAVSGNIRAASVVLPAIRLGSTPYVSLPDLARLSGGRLQTFPQKQKVELKTGSGTYVFTLLSPVVVINNVAYRLPREARYHDGAVHIPAAPHLLKRLFSEPYRLQEWVAVFPPPSRSAPPPGPDPAKTASKLWAIRTIVLDPGHGGKDPGAIGPGGTYEKKIALQIARRLKPLLEKRLKVKVILTRNRDTFVPLLKRSQFAIQNEGKLFVSIHCNATTNRKANGWEIYFLSEAKTEAAAEVARKENAVIQLETEDTGAPKKKLDDTLQGIALHLLSSQFLKESQDLAASIRKEVDKRVPRLKNLGVKQANFHVMRGTMAVMPSVLVECGFISNRSEEKRLRTRAFQKQMAEAICRGIQNFKNHYERQFVKN